MKISKKQLAANRRNAAKSTGPKASAAKAKVAKNAIKHGLRSHHIVIDGESQAEFDDFRDDLLSGFNPVGPLEQHLADRVIASIWRLNRIGKIEVELINNLSVADSGPSADTLPFTVRITKTYEGSPNRYVDEPIYEEPVSEPDKDKLQKRTLGEVIRSDLAGDNILSRFYRYEAHIDRVMYRALHELQRLQAKHLGQSVSAPVSIDVSLNTDG